jgi:hypothetical protein
MESTVRDLYVQNIPTSAGTPEQVQLLLREAVESYMKQQRLASRWGKLTICKVPSSQDGESYATYMGFIGFEQRQWHEEIAGKLDKLYFHGRQLKVTINKKPPRYPRETPMTASSIASRESHSENRDWEHVTSNTSSSIVMVEEWVETKERESEMERRSLTSLVDEYARRISAMVKQVAVLEENSKSLERETKEKDCAIMEKEKEIEELKMEKTEREWKLRDREREIAALEAKLEERDRDIAELDAKLGKREREEEDRRLALERFVEEWSTKTEL